MTGSAEMIVVVTGASRNVGFEIARLLLTQGATVFITARSASAVADAAGELSRIGDVHGLVADSSDPSAMGSLLAEVLRSYGAVDGLINNAGAYEEAPVLDVDRAALARAMQANVETTLVASQVVGRQMVIQRHGAIVNVASTSGHGADAESAAYSVAKASVVALSRALAVELGPYGVRCNSVSPGYIDTPKTDTYPPERRRWLRQGFRRAPLGRIATAKEVAAGCSFLVSSAASGISGIDLKVDCGQSSYLHVAATYGGQ